MTHVTCTTIAPRRLALIALGKRILDTACLSAGTVTNRAHQAFDADWSFTETPRSPGACPAAIPSALMEHSALGTLWGSGLLSVSVEEVGQPNLALLTRSAMEGSRAK